jgi:cephalosporin hydroxylase
MVNRMHDDRQEFAELQRDYSRRLHEDATLQRLSTDATWQADLSNYSYVWTWLGLPIIQMPTDVLVMQEIIWAERPQIIVETGVARGGSLIMYASILELIGEGRVIGVDIDIRPHNRDAIESHPLARRVELIQGPSTDAAVIDEVRSAMAGAERVMVVLDSDHVHDHVLAELRAYGPMVTRGQFLVVADTVVEHLPAQEHRPRRWHPGNSPGSALNSYLAECDRFAPDEYINGKLVMSQSPGGYLRCLRGDSAPG